MAPEPTSDPLDDPEYLRGESRRFRKITQILADPEIKEELAAHSLYLAQRAEALERVAEDPAVIRMNVRRYRALLSSGIAEDDKRAVEMLLDQAEQALEGAHTLRELAVWYRSFAERAGNPAIWEARILMAEDLDGEADRIERRNRLSGS